MPSLSFLSKQILKCGVVRQKYTYANNSYGNYFLTLDFHIGPVFFLFSLVLQYISIFRWFLFVPFIQTNNGHYNQNEKNLITLRFNHYLIWKALSLLSATLGQSQTNSRVFSGSPPDLHQKNKTRIWHNIYMYFFQLHFNSSQVSTREIASLRKIKSRTFCLHTLLGQKHLLNFSLPPYMTFWDSWDLYRQIWQPFLIFLDCEGYFYVCLCQNKYVNHFLFS